MQHANAPLTQMGRLRLVLLVEEDGFTLQAAADACNVAKSTCWEWVRRWRAASEPERVTLACLEDRSSRPYRRQSQGLAQLPLGNGRPTSSAYRATSSIGM